LLDARIELVTQLGADLGSTEIKVVHIASAGGHRATTFELIDLMGFRWGSYGSQVAIIAGADKYTERVTRHRVTAHSAVDVVAWTGQMAIDTADANLQVVDRVGSVTHLTLVTAGA
jgi:hypothetical protein